VPPPTGGLRNLNHFQHVRDSLYYVPPVLIACTVTCLALRLRRPRPPLRQLVDFPGTSAVIAVTCVVTLQTALMALQFIGGTRSDFVITPLSHNFYVNPGFAVVGAWSVIILGGHW
jgi:hypothetical protein